MELSLQKIKSAVNKSLKEHVEFCFLLGSAATPRFRKDSDVDIAIYWKNPEISLDLTVEIINKLESDLVGHSVDLISLNKIDIIYGMQVLDSGRLLIDNNPGLLLNWKATQLSRYPDFKASRQIIEENILNRKKYV